MSTDAATTNPEAYHALDVDQQRDLLDEGFERQRPDWEKRTRAEQSRAFKALRGAEAESVEVSDDMSETERAMQEALQDTRTAHLFEDLENTPTVPFELRRIPSDVRDIVDEVGGIIHSGEAIESEEDLEDLIEASSFQDMDDINDWIVAFLEWVTVDPAFDAERFESGHGMVEGTRKHLMLDIYLHQQEDIQRVAEFRTERAGLSRRN